MEVLVIALAIFTAAASLGLGAFVLLKVAGRRPEVPRRIASTAGFRWLLLGLTTTVVFLLLDIMALLPALVATGGLTATVAELLRKRGP